MPDSRTEVTADISSWPMAGRAMGIWSTIQVPPENWYYLVKKWVVIE
jgi:hypothetical protein